MIRVLNALFEDRYGGPQKRVIDVGAGLLKQGVETLLLLPVGIGSAAGIAEANGLKVVRVAFNRMPKPKHFLKVLFWLLLLPRDVYLISKVISTNGVDVVHVNGAFFLAPALATKLSGRSLVWHLNDTIVTPKFARILGMIVKWIADEVVVAAEAVAHHYCVGRGKYRVIYAPVDVIGIRKKTSYKQAGVAKRIGLVGNWNPLKGLDVFVEAASIVASSGNGRVEFAIAGAKLQSHAEYAAKIEQLILGKGLQDRIHCNGFVEDMASFLQGLDVLVLSSWSEACPMAVLEGMAAGVPIVATDVGGVRELLNPDTDEAAGFVVKPGDASGMAKHVLELLGDWELCEKMGGFGRKMTEALFSEEACVASHLKVYQSLRMGE